MPKKATKHITVHPSPIGTIKDGKIKVLDGETQTTSWRQGTKGMLKDFDGEPTSEQHNLKDLKHRPRHHVHSGSRQTKNPPHAPHDPSSGKQAKIE